MTLAFHAAPPDSHWINDPNGLAFADGAYRLFVQHRADAPDYRATGWARFSSPDLLRWSFDGPVIPPEGQDWAYSGSVTATEAGLEAVHTLHAAGLERQVRRTSVDGGARWSAPEPLPALGEAAPNRRDPCVFPDGDGWTLLLSEPCDWTGWRDAAPSRLRLYRSDDRRTWREAGVIGPWSPPGVMWEVPVLARLDGHDVLFVSTVDRRGDRADCAVRAWVGALRPDGFRPDPRGPAEGQAVDFGPDFYALMSSTPGGWPEPEPVFVAWLSSWATARTLPWPGFAGGPISLPRRLSIQAGAGVPWVTVRPLPSVLGRFARPCSAVPAAGCARAAFDGDSGFRLHLRSASTSAVVEGRPETGEVDVERTGAEPLGWRARHAGAIRPGPTRSLTLFVDGPAVELFLLEDGVAVSLALPVEAGVFDVELTVAGRPTPLAWTTLAD